MYKYLIILILTVGCGEPQDVVDVVIYTMDPTTYPFKGIDPEIQEYYDMFSAEYNMNVSRISATFGDTGGFNTLGVCLKYGNGYREMVINRDSWDLMQDSRRQSLIFHELGHCALNLEHDDSYMDTEELGLVPASIMNSRAISAFLFDIFKEHYLNQLKGE